MKVAEGNRAGAFRPLHVDRRFQRSHRNAHVRGICRDAVFAGPKDSQRAVGAGDGRAARAGLALVARHGGVAEIHTSSALEDIAGGRRHVPQLG